MHISFVIILPSLKIICFLEIDKTIFIVTLKSMLGVSDRYIDFMVIIIDNDKH